MTNPPVPEIGVPTCYRHPDRETYISCQRCGRPICPDCMTEAAVGFQCPSCVAEGRRTQREARTPYGGRIAGNRAVVTLTLIGLNLAVYVLIFATGGDGSSLINVLAEHARGLCTAANGGYFPNVGSQALCERGVGGTWTPGVSDGAYWQLLTSQFAHVQPLHLGFNMLALYVLGPQLEAVLGRGRFLALYLLSGFAGSAAVYWLGSEVRPTLGASGAIFGLMAALLIIARRVGADYQQILMWIGLNFLITLVGSSYISWQAHLGGFLGGLVVSAILAYAPRERRTAVQAGGLFAVGVVIAIAILARTVVLM
ncbi:rhomboid family intramembrane serine protease [Nocardioides fonticola]|uniref:Rhomboid family intramembrane serine protease n=1 Tax=Nocardioides fonticola TaxID=450363 RepID=A0ABP7XTE3_9ACTN